MSEPFLGEIKIVSFNFPPKGWAFCNGQQLPINQNQALFAILGTTYGGNGQTTFALPDFRGRVPVHVGDGITLGEKAGQEAHTVIISEMPAHTHTIQGDSNPASQPTPVDNSWGQQDLNPYSNAANTTMNPTTSGLVGGGQPHTNIQPFLVLNFIIALQGIFPSQN